MRGIRMRLAAPLMSFGGPRIDYPPVGLPIPPRSMLTGLLGAALGVDRREAATLQALQDTMAVAVMVRRPGREVIDYQTCDLDRPYMRATSRHPSWTLDDGRLRPWWREGIAVTGTRPRWRPYLADADMTAVVGLLDHAPFEPERLVRALEAPAFPVSFGRRSCPLVRRIADGVWEADGLELAAEAVAGRTVYVPVEHTAPASGDLLIQIPGTRDWSTRAHGGVDIYVRRTRAAARAA